VEKSVYELAILQRISTADPSHSSYKHVIHEHTGHNGKHLCLVFKVMGKNVSALRREFPSRQIPAALMKQIARQVLFGLDYLHQSCGVIHTGRLLFVPTF
jgi:serine/threonine-protein kinase SRPK3